MSKSFSMRPRHLIFDELFDVMGGPDEVAGFLGVANWTVRKYEEDPGRSGREMPVPVLDKLFVKAGDLMHNARFQDLIDELLNSFARLAGRRVIRGDHAEMIKSMLDGNGNDYDKIKSEQVARCVQCFAPMRVEGRTTNGLIIYRCLVCGERGEEAVF